MYWCDKCLILCAFNKVLTVSIKQRTGNGIHVSSEKRVTGRCNYNSFRRQGRDLNKKQPFHKNNVQITAFKQHSLKWHKRGLIHALDVLIITAHSFP